MSLPFRLYLISDRTRMGPDPAGAVAALIPRGLRAFQWREKDLTPRENLEHLSRIRAEVERWPGFSLFVNDRADLAMISGVHLHLTEASIPTEAARSLLPRALLGRSIHSLEGAESAQQAGADFITFGPVFETASKQIYGPPLGISALARICRAVTIPVLALGGIRLESVPSCLEAGTAGVAVIGAVWNSPDPGKAVEAFVSALDRML